MTQTDLNLDILKTLPFANYVGVEPKDARTLTLKPKQEIENHIGTVHAAAQFTLAETQSGLYLLSLFPEYADEVLPLLRSSTIKYKAPANTEMKAFATVSIEAKDKFEAQYLRKGRAIITVHVDITDTAGTVTLEGDFVWYVQKRED